MTGTGQCVVCGKLLGESIVYFLHGESFCSHSCINKKHGVHFLEITKISW